MFVKRVKLRRRGWFLAAALGGVFFGGCMGNKDVEQPLSYMNAWDVPANITLELGGEVYRIMSDAVVGAIKNAPALAGKTEVQNELPGIIMGADSLTNNIMRSKDGDYERLLFEFMTADSTARVLLEKNGLDARAVAKDVAGDIKNNDFIKGISDPASTVVISFGLSERLPALDGMGFLSGVSDRKLNLRLDIYNGVPFSFTVYALFFDEQYRELIDSKDSSAFLNFIKSGGYKDAEYSGGIISFFDNGKLEVKKGRNPDLSKLLSDEMPNMLFDYIDGTKPLAWRWAAELGGIGSEGNLAQSDGIKVMLSINVAGTITF